MYFFNHSLIYYYYLEWSISPVYMILYKTSELKYSENYQ